MTNKRSVVYIVGTIGAGKSSFIRAINEQLIAHNIETVYTIQGDPDEVSFTKNHRLLKEFSQQSDDE